MARNRIEKAVVSEICAEHTWYRNSHQPSYTELRGRLLQSFGGWES